MNLLRLRYFIEAAKCDSFSIAARSLYTTQPNISKQIKLLEEELGIKLFNRDERSISLTPAGKHIFDELKNIPGIIDRVCVQAKKISFSGRRTFSIGSLAFPSISVSLSKAIKKISAEDPSMVFEVELGSFSQMRDGLISHYYDMVLLYTFDLPDINENTEHKVILSQAGMVAVNTDHPLAGRTDLSLADFKDYDFVTTSPDESWMNYNGFIELCAERGFVPKIARTAKTLDTLLFCVETGLGACLVDANVSLTDYSNLVLVPISDNIGSEIAAIWLEENKDTRVKELADILSDTAKLDTGQRVWKRRRTD